MFHPTKDKFVGEVARPNRKFVSPRTRSAQVFLVVCLSFVAVGAQLVRLAWQGQVSTTTAAIRSPLATSFSRPDIVDRAGRLLATDVAVPSVFVDPARVLNPGTLVEQLDRTFPELDRIGLAALVSNRSKRFVWIKRHISPDLAQKIHGFGLPGLNFRDEIKRVYPRVAFASHLLGHVDIDNKGIAGFERYLDQQNRVTPVNGVTRARQAAVSLSLDMASQQALSRELADAMIRYKAKAAAGLVLDVTTGEIIALSSQPQIDPTKSRVDSGADRPDRLTASTYELGSVFKLFTVAMALDAERVQLDTKVDVSTPLKAGSHTITDLHAHGRVLTVSEIFLKSSNVGAGALALELGKNRQAAFYRRLGLMHAMDTEAGPVAAAQIPKNWGDAETVTMSYGHGIAVAPLQFAAAAAALVNGGQFVKPTLLRAAPDGPGVGPQIIKRTTSDDVRELMRKNVRDRSGTGWRADVPGYRVGGKTGTAELPRRGGYDQDAVISSFVAAFPMDAPKYLTFVMLFEPQPVAETGGAITAGRNAAPATGRLIKRIAPLLGVAAR